MQPASIPSNSPHGEPMGVVTSINAVTLHTTDMGLSIAFYVAMGFRISFGDPDASFTTVTSGDCFVNLWLVDSDDEVNHSWGRIIFHVDNVDILYQKAIKAGLEPRHPPRDAPWGERVFPINDPMGHDLSFAKTLTT
jgi:predicted enzyme related to lactoylglutathione lyase